ncbi:MAG TPA: 3-dehydroquinate synthase [bacterium]|nr:3-dehydroquinate synthase [bacterium]
MPRDPGFRTMIRLNVRHQNGTYPIFIGLSLLDHLSDYIPADLRTARGCIVADRTVWTQYGSTVTETTGRSVSLLEPFVFNPGERSKSLQTYRRLLDHLCFVGMSRHDFIIALGGGVTGDLAGFAAATFMRGIPFLQLPTTLLAQVDSSVGGKTAINLPAGKNLAGAFHAPRAVVSDIRTLNSLPARQFTNGASEIIKIALATDGAFFQQLRENGIPDPSDAPRLIQMIHHACHLKARIVEADEKDHGIRERLNLGHTFGHAIETTRRYRKILHGEAVGLGIIAATHYAVHASLCPPGLLDTVLKLLSGTGLPVTLQDLDADAAVEAMNRDKKRRSGCIRLILPEAPGIVKILDGPDPDRLRAAFSFLCR